MMRIKRRVEIKMSKERENNNVIDKVIELYGYILKNLINHIWNSTSIQFDLSLTIEKNNNLNFNIKSDYDWDWERK